MNNRPVRALVALLIALVALSLATVPVAVPAAADPITPTNGLKLTITSLTPTVLTASTGNVAVSGSVTNISDRQIDNVKVRLQLGAPVTSDRKLAAALAGTAPTDQVNTPYMTVTDTLRPGQTASVSITATLQGPGSLQIDQAGVYPMLVNVQGQPAYGGQARLAAASLLLPVQSVPGGHALGGAPAVPPKLTVLWPLVDDSPRVVGNVPGGHAVLSDDALANSLDTGGRLFGLVQAARAATTANPGLLAAMCFAIDPDLLRTVDAMAHGYQVRTPSGGTRPGTGTAAAALWLQLLQKLTVGNCVLALPEADADLAALTRAGGVNLAKSALADSAEVGRILPDTIPLSGVAWPADGALDNAGVLALAGLGVNSLLLSQNAVSPAGGAGTVPVTGAPNTRAVLIDQALSDALTPSADPSNVDTTAVSAQNGIGAWIYRTMVAAQPGRADLIAPPRRWSSAEPELEAFLDALGGSLTGHFASPLGLIQAMKAAPDGPAVRPAYPAAAAAAEIPAPVAQRVVTDDQAQQDVLAAMGRDHVTPAVSPAVLVNPLRDGLLRAMSSAWRPDHAGAAARLAEVERQFNGMINLVRVVPTNQTFSLGSQDSRLPVAVSNGLPVDIEIRLDLQAQAGLAPSAVQQTIPAGGSSTLYLPVRMTRSGRFSVDVSVATPGGTLLGQSARFELVSGAYGTAILIITIVAFGVLVLLSARRIYRRLRKTREGTDDEHDLPTLPGEQTVPNIPTAQEPVEH